VPGRVLLCNGHAEYYRFASALFDSETVRKDVEHNRGADKQLTALEPQPPGRVGQRMRIRVVAPRGLVNDFQQVSTGGVLKNQSFLIREPVDSGFFKYLNHVFSSLEVLSCASNQSVNDVEGGVNGFRSTVGLWLV
jgi:hypothetical protein